MMVKPCQPNLDCKIVFSGLDASVAGDIERAFAQEGYWVFSNARNYRMEPDVPLVIAELNADHLDVIPFQQKSRGWPGAIVTNSNCSVMVFALSLGPIHRSFGVEAVQVVTFQAIS
jgi:aspartate-semialdehyde dehydrogenase